MRRTALYLNVIILSSAVFYTTLLAQGAVKAKRLPGGQDTQVQTEAKSQKQLEGKTETAEKALPAVPGVQQGTTAGALAADLSGVSGSSIVNRNPNTQYNDTYQLIPVNNTVDAQKVTAYLDDLIKGGFNGTFEQSPSTTNWVFVSSADENIVYNKPYLKKGMVWFDVTAKKDKNLISLWLFQMPAGQDFRVRFNGDKSAEMSSAVLLGERFKKGIFKPQKAGAFEINSSGEYYEEDIVFYSDKGETGQKAFGNISYLSNISAKIGTMFGFEYTLLNRITRNYNFKCIHPPYSSGPEQGDTEFMMSKKCVPNKKDNFIWKITEAYELVPGSWKLQILDGGVLIYQKNFNISVASTAQPAAQARSGMSPNVQPSSAGRVQLSQSTQREAANKSFGTLLKEALSKDQLFIALTPQQSAAVSGSNESEVTIQLTDKQFETIRKRYPKASKRTMKINLSSAAVAAPMVPGAGALSAVVSGVGSQGEAVGSVSRDDDSQGDADGARKEKR